MIQRRRLSDLWVVGRDVVFDDGEGDPVTVWLQKLTSAEVAEAGRNADAKKALVLIAKTDHDSDEYNACLTAVLELGDNKDDLLQILVTQKDRPAAQRRCEAQVAEEDEWKKENYLQGLWDAWSGGLEDSYARDPEDPEASKVFGELKRYDVAVTELVDEDVELTAETYRERELADLRDTVVDHVLDMRANQVWLIEFWAWQVVFSVRDPENHKSRYFANREEVGDLHPETYRRIRDAYDTLEVDVVEGKSSGGPVPSSPSSDSYDAPATDIPSGLTAVSA